MVSNASIDALLDSVADELKRARRVLFITGAGISADSGLPTYRGVGGLYDREETVEGLSIEQALSGEMFSLHPEITWKYLLQIEESCRDALPNAAHLAIAALENVLKHVTVFTQNVDGLHRAAGSRDLIEIHGNLQSLICIACDYREAVESLGGRPIPPLCPTCGAILRPDIVLFGEALPEAALDRFIASFQEGFDLVFSVGTSSLFPYIVQPVVVATASGIPTVEINPARTQLSDIVDYHLPLGAARAMGEIAGRLGIPLSRVCS